MSMQIIKQLYDIGNLFDTVTELDTIKSTFRKFVDTELVYRDNEALSLEDVLDDIYQTSLCIVSRGVDGKGNFTELQDGIRSVSGFISSETYHIEKAIIHASKAAWLATLIRFNITNTIEKYKDPLQIKDWTLFPQVNSKLNRLKKSNPEAFFYWYQISKLISTNTSD